MTQLGGACRWVARCERTHLTLAPSMKPIFGVPLDFRQTKTVRSVLAGRPEHADTKFWPSDGFGRLGPRRWPRRERNDGAGPLIYGHLPTTGLSTDSRPEFGTNGHHITVTRTSIDETPGGIASWVVTTQRGRKTSGSAEPPLQVSAPTIGKRAAQPTRAQIIKRVNANFAKTARMPFVPRGEYKIVVRPRGGLLVGKVMMPELVRAVASAAKVNSEEIQRDTVCPNLAKNIIVISTPEQARVSQYASV
ncbi:hypothetical protein HPB51_011416 [Rhipicephalus microplus]|uniref:Uncharacterized protein n=1 Tax=Rhipicephalus microplus TaxID=6941 RepID=A0A9J6F295_RHIMP|nr:hypothetical protein HPB51_011416 [Rhipicephalus microplus]